MIDNQFNFSHVLVRCSFDDKNGNVRTLQGYVMIESSNLSIAPGALVKADFSLPGNGKLIMFDGFVPCPTVITSITVGGQTAPDGIVHITYTYTGDAYQIKYRIDNMGDYAYAAADLQLDIPGLALGSDHSVEIIPVCQNDFEGTGLSQSFEVTQALTCSTVITDIAILTLHRTVNAVYTGSATQMKYRFDFGTFQFAPITQLISYGGLSIGSHTIQMIPICANNVEGTGFVKPLTITTQPTQSRITVDPNIPGTGLGKISLYVNHTLTFTAISPSSPVTLSVPVGAEIKIVLTLNGTRTGEIKTEDTDTSTVLDDQTFMGPGTIQYIFTTNGDSYTCTGTIT